jgi:hypothetical protein
MRQKAATHCSRNTATCSNDTTNAQTFWS